MKFFCISAVTATIIYSISAANVEYSVIAFPTSNQSVFVSIENIKVELKKSEVHQNIYSGMAPYGENYQYVITDGKSDIREKNTRKLMEGVNSTGYEFFDRSQTLYDVPDLPQAFDPVYPTLFTTLNKSNEIATIIMTADAEQLDKINAEPMGKLKDAMISNFAYISHKEVHTFKNSGLSTSGQSTKDFSKQSYEVNFNAYKKNVTEKQHFFGRTSIKLRAEETDSTFVREKLVLDMIAASGGATLSASWVRVFINNEPYGLFLMVDDISTHLINSILHGGNFENPTTGVTYKGNALSPEEEGNLDFVGENKADYSSDLYKLVDTGRDNRISKKNNSQLLIIDFIKRLKKINITDAIDSKNPGSIAQLVDPKNTLIHIAINFLVGSWDGFWHQASNYYLNNDLSNDKWTLITYDFDETFGNSLEDSSLRTVSYKKYARPGSHRPLIDVFIKNPYYDDFFQTILKTMVKRFFKPDVINPRLEAWSKMLEEEIIWTRSIPGRSPGEKTSYTLKDFHNSLTGSATDSVRQWVVVRVDSLTKQLNFTQIDDIPSQLNHTEAPLLNSTGKITGSSDNNNGESNSTVIIGGDGVSAKGDNNISSNSASVKKVTSFASTVSLITFFFFFGRSKN